MIYRGLFLTDGTSDAPLSDHLERLCARHGRQVRITVPDISRLPGRVGSTVESRLRAVLELDSAYDIIFVHRDAEGQHPNLRYAEIGRAFEALQCALPSVPVVPIRMTEAWLLLDEAAIREVAGRPSGTINLGLPPLSQIETVADAKSVLRRALVTASQLRGRRSEQFRRRFHEHRRQLLARIDHDGPITALTAWRSLLEAVASAMAGLPAGDTLG